MDFSQQLFQLEMSKQTELFNDIDNILNITDFVLVQSNFHESKSNCWYVCNLILCCILMQIGKSIYPLSV